MRLRRRPYRRIIPRWRRLGPVRWRFKVEPRDCWIGVYWRWGSPYLQPVGYRPLDVYVCIVPCVPLIVRILRPLPPGYWQVNL